MRIPGSEAQDCQEVDLVAKNPLFSTDAIRDAHFLNPLVFEQRLPVCQLYSRIYRTHANCIPFWLGRAVVVTRECQTLCKGPRCRFVAGMCPASRCPRRSAPVFKLDRPISEYALRL